MGLYDREYIENYAYEEENSGRVATLIKDTYKLLTASMVAAAAGAYSAMKFGISLNVNPLIYLVIMLGVLFAMQFAVNRRMNTLALTLLFAFTFITGLTIGKIIAFYISAGAGHIVTQAFVLTAVAFGGLTFYAIKSQADFSSWAKPLFYSLIGVIVVGLLNYFFFHSTLLSFGISVFSAILFSAYILFDTKNIINGVYDSPIMAAVSMYLNIYNLFLSLLNILGFANRD